VLDTLLSAWKIEGRAPPPEAEAALAVYESLLAARGSLDFDDLVVRAARLLDEDASLRDRWQRRFSHVLVDEFQDVDAAQLRVVRLLAAPEDNPFVVGDDDQPSFRSHPYSRARTGAPSLWTFRPHARPSTEPPAQRTRQTAMAVESGPGESTQPVGQTAMSLSRGVVTGRHPMPTPTRSQLTAQGQRDDAA
jgi:hypothetical protein